MFAWKIDISVKQVCFEPLFAQKMNISCKSRMYDMLICRINRFQKQIREWCAQSICKTGDTARKKRTKHLKKCFMFQ
ncbi:hypothetical protein J416_10776 [Gracilibacillus halophilus YIM-C55.5]|uniref:Uncharacterized protein n=1 Tax=Gracilibacillus halophilus YIM-C55.5 TaxID=1308866 RepID=N4WJT6_9BACI|nr:hypothetical protein J416_10776 [Gracilibacillus halophilus YIM-C55.5]